LDCKEVSVSKGFAEKAGRQSAAPGIGSHAAKGVEQAMIDRVGRFIAGIVHGQIPHDIQAIGSSIMIPVVFC
jgi:hypothetical protein